MTTRRLPSTSGAPPPILRPSLTNTSTPAATTPSTINAQDGMMTPTPQSTTSSSTTFPSPQTFDIIPPLHALLVRLLSTPSQPTIATGQSTSAGAGAAGGTPAPPGAAGNTPGGPTTSSSSSSIDPKALLTESSAVKIRIQKARAAVEALPDIQRSVTQQEEEIRMLERKIERLREVIGEFGVRGGSALSK
ncbi:hypothetical protein AJ80_04419 [Polytolypa hystricis UAMH7299]|uniref:Mediator of RNA polymerase II transcription subunit 9 n=1 Tax=Polytolypa hystricis (strain UAMH7299) TaxID=1447883 RepID=A0A2B7YC87_POLH7|nr:hypothetical protein AJ80_04419 [Polytolypa hystricis UAMH7299]